MPVQFDNVDFRRVKSLRLPLDLNHFFTDLPAERRWNMGVAGSPGAGKSTFLLFFAAVLCKYGKVLYDNVEEDLNGATLQKKMRDIGLDNRIRVKAIRENFQFMEDKSIDSLRKELASGKYKYCIIDSASVLQKKNKLKLDDILHLSDEFPEVSFIYVLHYLKDKSNYKGASDLEHLFDMLLMIEKGGNAYFQKNRFRTFSPKNIENINIHNYHLSKI